MKPPPIKLRSYEPSDALALLELFRDTVHRINCRDYTSEQIAAWAPDDLSTDPWAERFEGKITYVAQRGYTIVGFADMMTSGYLDRLFVSADCQRQGVARRLLRAILHSAADLQLTEVTTEASITAKPFFLAQSFVVVQKQTVVCRGKEFTNYLMRYVLS
ncbi:GCN5-related N-acetyltransferase [Rhodopirellula maiorica SM1]|uniref:GCN5-related N-acetyltransferase n=2 Tax=Novipirellula TaxID=2795426 RepID=M5RVT2_9BACT|nr:GCN5-related N-acetyltransferase [Rhodopirellula maiorica SM1]